LDGGEAMTSIRELVSASIEGDPVLNDAGQRFDLTRTQARERSMRKIAQVVQVIRERNADAAAEAAEAAAANPGDAAAADKQLKKQRGAAPVSEEDQRSSRAGAGKAFEDAFYSTLASIDPSWSIRIGVHFGLFLSALMGSGSEEQIAHYARDVQEMRVIGCFAMTEMAHGSYVQGLETTATLDLATDEWIIHSPTVTATKWWIGGAGETATLAAVFAQTIVKGQKLGIQTFLVPIRSLVTGKPEPNIEIGDMGAKMGRNGLDNGWIRFEHKRVPRTAMLSKWARVDRDGTFHPPPNRQMAYNALIGTRVELFSACASVLKKALTIAIRYSLVRRQFARKDGLPGETKLLDYATHQALLFPILAHTFALHFTAKQTSEAAEAALKSIAAAGVASRSGASANNTAAAAAAVAPALDVLPELHATSSGLKAIGTWYANDAIESCRQSLGGMGYSSYAGLAGMRADWAVMCTWEGDNNVLALQCARFLTKQQAKIKRGKVPRGVAAYLAREDVLQARAPAPGETMTEEQWLDPKFQLLALRHRAARLVRDLSASIDSEASTSGVSFEVAAERLGARSIPVTRAHCYAFMLACFEAGVRAAPKELQQVLTLLRNVFALQHIEQNLGDFLEDGFLSGAHAASLRALLRTLYTRLRPHALALVDSFGLPDFVVESPLGREDGDVYNAMFSAVRAAPNAQGVPPYFQELIRPLTDPNFKKQE
jgi:acyl-CoA oxidase